MKLTLPALGFSTLALVGCAQSPTNDILGCTEALLAANTIRPDRLLALAASTPACIALGADVLQIVINDVVAKQKARGVRE